MLKCGVLEELFLASCAPPKPQLEIAREYLLRELQCSVDEEATEMAIEGESLAPLLLGPLCVRFQQGIGNFSTALAIASHDIAVAHRHPDEVALVTQTCSSAREGEDSNIATAPAAGRCPPLGGGKCPVLLLLGGPVRNDTQHCSWSMRIHSILTTGHKPIKSSISIDLIYIQNHGMASERAINLLNMGFPA